MRELNKVIAMGIYITLAVIVAITIITVAYLLAYLAFHIHPMLGYVVFAGVFLMLVNCVLREIKCF